MKNCSIYFFSLWLILASLVSGYPYRPQLLSSSTGTPTLQYRTTQPYFPDYPPSCPICANNYPSINNCAQAAPILANFSMVRTNYDNSRTMSFNRLCLHRSFSILVHSSVRKQFKLGRNSADSPPADVIKCACADTFQSVFPQCVDWCVFLYRRVSALNKYPVLPKQIKPTCSTHQIYPRLSTAYERSALWRPRSSVESHPRTGRSLLQLPHYPVLRGAPVAHSLVI
jgi:hypothetical protein